MPRVRFPEGAFFFTAERVAYFGRILTAERVAYFGFDSRRAHFDGRASRLLRYGGASLSGPSVFDLSVSGRPPTSSEAAGPLEKKQNKHCF